MARVFSIISSQSGVGKTLVTVVLAEFFSGLKDTKVLVIDLDGGATTMLTGEHRWQEIDEGHAIARLIQDQLEPDAGRFHFDFDAAVRRGVSNVHDARTIDLLPCNPNSVFRFPDQIVPVDLLWRAVKSNLDDYDIVLIDCRSGLDGLTRNALRISDGYIVPATSHFNLLTGSTAILDIAAVVQPAVWKVAAEMNRKIELHGIVINRYRQNRRRPHIWEQLMAIGYEAAWITPVAVVPEIRRLPEFATEKEYRTLRQKWGYRLTNVFTKLAHDLLRSEGMIHT